LEGHELWIILYNLAKSTYDSGSQSAQNTFFSRIRDLLETHPMKETLQVLLDSSSFMVDQTFQDLPPQKVLEHIENLFLFLEEQTQKRDREALARDLRQAEAIGDQETVHRLLEQLNS